MSRRLENILGVHIYIYIFMHILDVHICMHILHAHTFMHILDVIVFMHILVVVVVENRARPGRIGTRNTRRDRHAIPALSPSML